MYYSVCLNALFGGLSIDQAIRSAHACGLNAFEIWGWWDADLEALTSAKAECGMHMTAMCTRMVSLTDPEKREAYLNGLKETIGVAKRMRCSVLISQVGNELAHLSREAQHQSIVDGLKACVPLLEEADMTLVIEPLNVLVDHPGYFLTRAEEAFAIVREVGSAQVRVLYDVYHQQITEGNLIPTIRKNAEWIGHVHIAGHPGRHEVLGLQEIHYPAVLAALAEAGYTGAVGLEYFPVEDAAEGLKKLLTAIPLPSAT